MGYEAPDIHIYSNDGSTLLYDSDSYTVDSSGVAIAPTVTEKGLVFDKALITTDYIYTGKAKFIGFATSPNATEPTYAIGDTTFTNGSLYIVESVEGTTWYVPSGWSAIHNYGIFSVNYNYEYGTNSGSQSTLRIGYDNGSSDNGDNIIGFGTEAIYPTTAFTLTFTSGTDTTNPKLIAWLTEYGELQEEKITDLTGYTVTVPAGWSATAGYGLFDVVGTASYTASGSKVYYENYQFDTLNIGYFRTSPLAEYVSFANIGYEYSTSPEHSFILTFTGGDDVQESSLIQWLVDNNATFEKTGGEEEPDTPEIPTTPHGEIYYKGNLVATLVEGETIVLHTKDFKFLGDIVIKNVREAETPTLISFTIDGTTYQAEEGMTWGDWLESEYNVDDYTVNVHGMISSNKLKPGYYVEAEGSTHLEEKNIVANTNYSLLYDPTGGTGGGN